MVLPTAETTAYAAETITVPAGACLKGSCYLNNLAAVTSVAVGFEDVASGTVLNEASHATSSWTQKTVWGTALDTSVYYRWKTYFYSGGNNIKAGGADTATCKQLLTPSATGMSVEVTAFVAAGTTWQFLVYAYKTIPSGRVYSAIPLVLLLEDDSSGKSFVADLAWDEVADADGYKIVYALTDINYSQYFELESATNSATWAVNSALLTSWLPESPVIESIRSSNKINLGARSLTQYVDGTSTLTADKRLGTLYAKQIGATNGPADLSNHVETLYADKIIMYEQSLYDPANALPPLIRQSGFVGGLDSQNNPNIMPFGTIYFPTLKAYDLWLALNSSDTGVQAWYMDGNIMKSNVQISVKGFSCESLSCQDFTSTGLRTSGIIFATPNSITATNAGVAADITTTCTAVTTDGDSDQDNVTLINGVYPGMQKFIYCVAVGNVADTFKITPTKLLGGTRISFDAPCVGKGCTLIWATQGWVLVGTNGGVIS